MGVSTNAAIEQEYVFAFTPRPYAGPTNCSTPGLYLTLGALTDPREDALAEASLEALTRAKLKSQQLAEGCRIFLMSADAIPNLHQAETLRVDRQRIRRCRSRWSAAHEALVAAEKENPTDRDLEKLIVTALSDEERSGAPPTFSPEKVAAIIALACEPPEETLFLPTR